VRTAYQILAGAVFNRTLKIDFKNLKEKNAAGVVTLEGAVLYVFTYSVIAERLLKFFAPRASPLLTPNSNKQLLLILKQNQGQPPAVNNNAAFPTPQGFMNTMAPPMIPKNEPTDAW
jgi:hypothetical protein